MARKRKREKERLPDMSSIREGGRLENACLLLYLALSSLLHEEQQGWAAGKLTTKGQTDRHFFHQNRN